MLEIKANIWDIAHEYDAVVITTNGTISSQGKAVIGSGIALEARERYPWFASLLGEHLRIVGNHVGRFMIGGSNKYLYSFPTKHDWQDQHSDYGLIVRSCVEILSRVNESDKVLMPRPGVGAGKLPWETVREMIRLVLDDRFTVCSFPA